MELRQHVSDFDTSGERGLLEWMPFHKALLQRFSPKCVGLTHNVVMSLPYIHTYIPLSIVCNSS